MDCYLTNIFLRNSIHGPRCCRPCVWLIPGPECSKRAGQFLKNAPFHILEHYGPLPKGCFFKTLLSPFDTFVYLVISKWIMYLQVWAQISQELQRGSHSRVKFEKNLQFGEAILKTKSIFLKDQRLFLFFMWW